MLFSSNVFLFAFLPSVLAVYYLCPRRFRNPVLLLFSLFFYGWGEPAYLALMVGVTVMDYLCGLWIARQRSRGGNGKAPLAVGVALNLALLVFFKYGRFLFGPRFPNLPLPIGISFYVFQSMSYIIDVYRQDAPLQRNLLTFGAYVALFPQLIAGPIVRYKDVAQMLECRQESVSQFASGISRFIVGLSKKVLLANPMGLLWEILQQSQGTLAAWAGLAAYSFQIYFDFSGYSDMAIGLGRMFGFEFLENFDHPYISASITEFWRRWHISLSTWFKEYVYIPLGGNRRGMSRQVLNIAIVWLLTGLWHGASWNFVLWGGYYALLLIAEKRILLRVLQKCPRWIGRLYTVLAVMLGWALFYFEKLSELSAFLLRLVVPAPSAASYGILMGYLPILLIAAAASAPLLKALPIRRASGIAYVQIICLSVLLLLSVAALVSQSYNPFIYFRF